MKLVEKWNEDTLLRIGNLQLSKEFRVFSARQLEERWRREDTWMLKFDIQIVQESTFNTCNNLGVRYSLWPWSWPVKLGFFSINPYNVKLLKENINSCIQQTPNGERSVQKSKWTYLMLVKFSNSSVKMFGALFDLNYPSSVQNISCIDNRTDC